MKALARAVGVKGNVDYKDWGGLFRLIEQNVALIDKNWTKDAAKANALEFYLASLADARALNAVWRTANFHVRTGVTCDDNDAKKALERMSDLLLRLSYRVKESQRRQLSRRAFAT